MGRTAGTNTDPLSDAMTVQIIHELIDQATLQELTLSEWSRKSGVQVDQIRRYRTGQNALTLYMMVKLARGLGLEPRVGFVTSGSDEDLEFKTLTAPPLIKPDEEPSYESQIESPRSESPGTPKEDEAPRGAEPGQELSTVEGSPERVCEDVSRQDRSRDKDGDKDQLYGRRYGTNASQSSKSKSKGPQASFGNSDVLASIEQFLKERS